MTPSCNDSHWDGILKDFFILVGRENYDVPKVKTYENQN
jgi:hypothetical protein